jgi:branched-chain amino acid transport system substrate-binding protein
MRSFKFFGIFMVVALLLAACSGGGGAAQTKELKVAILAPLSGGQPTFGVSTRDGALLAVQQWNDKGGVLGMKITPIVEDSQCLPDPATNAAHKVIDQDKVHYIIGEVCSAASIPISDIANAAKVIQMSPTSTNPLVTVDSSGKTKPFIFRACFIDPFQGKVGAKFAYDNLKLKTAYVLYNQSSDYVRGLAENFMASFKDLGGTVVGQDTYTSSDTDFSAILSKVQAANPDMVYLPDYYNIVNLVTSQAKAKGMTMPFMGGDGWDSSQLDVTSTNGDYYTNHYDPSDTRPEVQTFIQQYGAVYKDDAGNPKVPDALAALAYDAANLLFTGIQNAGADDTDKVRVALENIKFDAVSGTITFDAQHDPIKPAVIVGIKDGKKQAVASVAP